MIAIYCRHKHASSESICDDCKSVELYAHERLDKCRFGDNKPTCEKCPIHCYKPVLRQQMRVIMRYSGPRMVFYYPIKAVKHLLHNIKKVYSKPRVNLFRF